MGTVWTSRNGQRTIQSEECKCGIFDFGLLSVSHFCKSKHRLLCGQKIYKLRQTKLSQFVEFSLILRKREETKTKYSLPKKQLEFEIEDADDAACVEKMFLADQKQIEDNFQKLDIDGDGQIDISEI